jgi:putative peptide zinc metalloprotease protein
MARDIAESPKLGHKRIAPTPSLAQGTELIGEYQGSGFKEPVFLVRRGDGQVIQLSALVYLVAAEADGHKDFEQIALRVSREFGRTVSADNVRFLVEEKLRPLGMIAANGGPGPKPMRAKPVLALKFRVPILPEGVIRALAVVFRPLFLAPVVVAMLAGLATLDLWLLFVHGLGRSASQTLYQPELFVGVFGLTLLSTIFHELGHATACHYGGAKPGRIGVGIYIVWPIFYNDVTDTYRLNRVGRLRTDLGGVYFDVIFALAIAGAYFLTGSEWLLLVVLLQQLDILFQFLPFVRLDGYYVVSDLTGVPDLFARIPSVLKSMIPGRSTDRHVEELKPWVRVVVTVWVLAAIPTLLCLFAMLIASAPHLYATAWDSFHVHYDKVLSAFGEGRMVAGIANLIRIVLLVIPVTGITLLFLMAVKRLGGIIWSWSRGRPALRAGLATIVLGATGAILPFVWWHSDSENKPIQQAEHAMFRGGAAPEVPTTPTTGRDFPTPAGAADEGRTPLAERDRFSTSSTPTTSATAGASASPAAGSAGASASPAAGSAGASASPVAGWGGASASPVAGSAGAPASPTATPGASASPTPAPSPGASASPTPAPGGSGRATDSKLEDKVIVEQNQTQVTVQQNQVTATSTATPSPSPSARPTR